ncbi:MAG TPA: helix-turn-helix transcriptional regulator [Polyangia bacterium]
MSQGSSITPQGALLRVLINSESDGPEIMRKVRDWTDGKIELDEQTFLASMHELVSKGMVESHAGPADKRTGQARQTYKLTTAGHSSAMEILAASLTRKG